MLSGLIYFWEGPSFLVMNRLRPIVHTAEMSLEYSSFIHSLCPHNCKHDQQTYTNDFFFYWQLWFFLLFRLHSPVALNCWFPQISVRHPFIRFLLRFSGKTDVFKVRKHQLFPLQTICWKYETRALLGETVTFIPVAIISTNSLFLVDVLFLWKPLPLAHSAFWLGHSLKKKLFSKEFRLCWGLNMCMKTILANQTYKKVSHTGNWTRVFWVKARYPNH